MAEEATRVGASSLYLFTRQSQSLYARLGWRAVLDEWYNGRTVTIMVRELPSR